ncbi:MAG: ATP-dependent helicase [Anaerolineae bacterium]|jgi:DNA helicase-2/ATP-dependent DNA helicase PcrA
MTEFRARPGQEKVLAYTGGSMGVSAVPGSGKTHTLAVLAAQLVAEAIGDDQEVLVVTLVNSAVDNFKQRINQLIAQRGLLAGLGYRVRTLHGLAHDIVRERPGLVGLSEDFGIIDEREAQAVREDAIETWLRAHPDAADPYLSPDVEGDRAEWVKRTRWPALVRNVAAAFIKRAKDLELGPEVLLERLARWDTLSTLKGPGSHSAAVQDLAARDGFRLARMGAEIYADYQRSLAYRGVVDFDDLIRLALEALQRDDDYLARLWRRWPYILEDEAQDSSKLQERILHLLSGPADNWVRVGDTNQAIYDTFTTANPALLREFLKKPGVQAITLEQSGRSQQAIMDLANYLVDWTCDEHPTPFARKNAFLRQYIGPTGPGDPQPNPQADPAAVQLVDRDFTPDRELLAVADSLARWMEVQAAQPEDERQTCGVLVPRNQRGFALIDLLRQRNLPYIELLRSTSTTRETAGALGNLLRCLADPTSARKLSTAFKVWRRDDRDDAEAKALTQTIARRIRSCQAVEAYLWPRADHDWLAHVEPELTADELRLLTEFGRIAQRWHRAIALPIDQLVLTLAGDLFHEPTELALAHKLAVLLRDVTTAHPTYHLDELVEELAVIARNERRFLGFSSEDTGFEPVRGWATVVTMHKAKGLEWDRVYLMSVNNYDFPSGLAHDTYIAERWYIRDNLNLEAEAMAQLKALVADFPNSRESGHQRVGEPSREGEATRRARLDYISERLRLLYVGITRAKSDLIVTWNTGRRRAEKLQPAVPFVALQTHLAARAPESRRKE